MTLVFPNISHHGGDEYRWNYFVMRKLPTIQIQKNDVDIAHLNIWFLRFTWRIHAPFTNLDLLEKSMDN